jgi:hypothetical protein
MLRRVTCTNRCFGGIYRLLHQGDKYNTGNIPEDGILAREECLDWLGNIKNVFRVTLSAKYVIVHPPHEIFTHS